MIILLCLLVSMFILISNVQKINKYLNKLDNIKNNEKEKILEKVTILCVKTPLKLYISQILVPLIAIPIILMFTGAELIVIFKISSVFILFLTLVAVICYVFSQSEFKKIIINIYSKGEYENNEFNL